VTAGERVSVSFGLGDVKVRLKGMGKFTEGLRKKLRRLDDLRPLWRRNVRDFGRLQAEWFDSEGRGTWAALAELTVEARTVKPRKRRDGTEYVGGAGAEGQHYAIPGDQGPASLILQWTGDMRFDLVSHAGDHSIAEITKDSLTFGTDRDRAAWNNPDRPVLAGGHDAGELQKASRLNVVEFVSSVLLDRRFDESGGGI